MKLDLATDLSVNHHSRLLIDTLVASLYFGGNGRKEVIIKSKNVKLPLVPFERTLFTCDLGESTLLNTTAIKNLFCVFWT